MNTLIELCSLADAYRRGEGKSYYRGVCSAAYAALPLAPDGRMSHLTALYLEQTYGAITDGMREAHRAGYNASLNQEESKP